MRSAASLALCALIAVFFLETAPYETPDQTAKILLRT